MYLSETHEKKWASPRTRRFTKNQRFLQTRSCYCYNLENQERAMKEDAAFLSFLLQLTQRAVTISNWDPILISLVRRAMLNLIAYDIAVYNQ